MDRRNFGRLGLGAAALALLPLGAARAQATKTVAITVIVEVPQLLACRDGVLKGLAEKGWTEGQNLRIDYQQANGNASTQQQIARKFVGDAADVIVPITTPSAQAVAAATDSIPVVFSTVTDPIKAGLIQDWQPSGSNITGVSDEAPIPAQLALIKELIPDAKRIGFIYNPGLDSSLSTLEFIRREAGPLGLEVVEAASPTTNEVIPASRKLVGNVDAIYIPNDTTITAAVETIVKIGSETGTPVFTGETSGVERGSIATVGLDYIEVGRLTGHMVAQVLEGTAPGEIAPIVAYREMPQLLVVVNRSAAAAMGVTIPEPVLARATTVIE